MMVLQLLMSRVTHSSLDCTDLSWYLPFRYDSQIPAAPAEAGLEAVTALGQRVAPIVEAYTSAMEARRIKDGIRLAMDVSREGNAFFQVWFAQQSTVERQL